MSEIAPEVPGHDKYEISEEHLDHMKNYQNYFRSLKIIHSFWKYESADSGFPDGISWWELLPIYQFHSKGTGIFASHFLIYKKRSSTGPFIDLNGNFHSLPFSRLVSDTLWGTSRQAAVLRTWGGRWERK